MANHSKREHVIAERTSDKHGRTLEIHLPHREIIIRRSYEVAALVNDLLIGIWFLIGSILFLYPNEVILGTWFFIVGSAQLMVRPCIRLARNVHISLVQGGRWEL